MAIIDLKWRARRQCYINSTPSHSLFHDVRDTGFMHGVRQALLDTVATCPGLKKVLSPFERPHLDFLVTDPFLDMRDN